MIHLESSTNGSKNTPYNFPDALDPWLNFNLAWIARGKSLEIFSALSFAHRLEIPLRSLVISNLYALAYGRKPSAKAFYLAIKSSL